MPGIYGDLDDITVYLVTTPVHFTSSNIPLEQLRDNILVLDSRLNKDIQSGIQAYSEAGDGTFAVTIAFPSPTPGDMTTAPRVIVGLADVHANALGKLHVDVANRTVSGFQVIVRASGTSGAWTANVHWLADGR